MAKKLSHRCLRCHRKLTNPLSQRIGYGSECAKKIWKGSTITNNKVAYESFGNYIDQINRDGIYHCECGLHITSRHMRPRDDLDGIPLSGFGEYQKIVAVCPHCGREIPLNKLRWSSRPNPTTTEGVPA